MLVIGEPRLNSTVLQCSDDLIHDGERCRVALLFPVRTVRLLGLIGDIDIGDFFDNI